jgi:hypothetical protein
VTNLRPGEIVDTHDALEHAVACGTVVALFATPTAASATEIEQTGALINAQPPSCS